MSGDNGNVVITGVGLVSPLGLTAGQTWAAIVAGGTGMGPLTALESAPPGGAATGGQAPDLPVDFAPDQPREVRYLRWALRDAWRDAGLESNSPYSPSRCAMLLGTTLHGMRAAGRYFRTADAGDFRSFLASSVVAQLRGGVKWEGLTATICSACSSSLGSIAMGATLLQSGQADLVIAGGYDVISEYVYGGFNSLRLVTDGPLRPFARDRRGMKLAEGYAIVILESQAGAARRGAKVLASILGWGESADAHHLTQPHPQGDGAARAMEQALRRANLSAADIDMVAAHATGTPDNDLAEHAALVRVLGDQIGRVPVVAFKSHLGHTLGGAGAVELILSAMALREQMVPACANITAEEVEFGDLRVATGAARPATLRATLNTSLGFGGANTCVILGSGLADVSGPDPEGSPACTRGATPDDDVFITGIGVVLPGAIGNEALVARVKADCPKVFDRDAHVITADQYEPLLQARRVRRMGQYVKLTLAATTLACRDANIADLPAFAADGAAVLGTTHGCSNFSADYYRQIVKEGLVAANPALFAEAVPNAAAAQLSLMLGLKGACQTVIGSRTAGLDALTLAAMRIGSGVWDRAIVSAGEEYCQLVHAIYRHCGLAAKQSPAACDGEGGFVVGEGAVSFILESRASLERRGVRPHGRIVSSAACQGDRGEAHQSALRVLDQLAAPVIVTSACATWVDRSEALALRRWEKAQSVSTVYGRFAETFSASPLIGIASSLLTGSPGAFAAICTDFDGSVSGVAVEGLGQ